MPLTVQVVTPEREVEVAADASMVLAHGVEGDVGILPGHAPLLIALGTGPLAIVRGDRRDEMLVDGGFLQVKDDRVIVLAEYAVLPGEIDPAAAAREVEDLRREAGSATEDGTARARLARAEAKLKLVRR